MSEKYRVWPTLNVASRQMEWACAWLTASLVKASAALGALRRPTVASFVSRASPVVPCICYRSSRLCRPRDVSPGDASRLPYQLSVATGLSARGGAVGGEA